MEKKRKSVLVCISLITAATAITLLLIHKNSQAGELEAFAFEDRKTLYQVEEYGENKHRIARINFDSGDPVWKSDIDISYRLNHQARRESPALFFDRKHVYYFIEDMDKSSYLLAYNKTNGSTVFNTTLNKGGTEDLSLNLYLPYLNLEDRIVVLNSSLKSDNALFTVVDKEHGSVIDRIELPIELLTFQPLGTESSSTDSFVLTMAGKAGIFAKKDLRDYRSIETSVPFGALKDEKFYFLDRKYHLIESSLDSGKEKQLWTIDKSILSIYHNQDHLILYCDKGTQTSFMAFDFFSGEPVWEYILPQDYYFADIFASDQSRYNPEAAVFYDVDYRYLPIILTNKLDEDGNYKKRIAVLNLKDGSMLWESRTFDMSLSDLLVSDIYKCGSRFIVEFDNSLILIDSESGRIEKAVRILRKTNRKRSPLVLPSDIKMDHFKDHHFFMAYGNGVIRLDLEKNDVQYIGDQNEEFFVETLSPENLLGYKE